MQMKKKSTFFLVARLVCFLGMDELQHSIWLLSTLVNAEKNRAMPEFTEVKYQTSKHHEDLSLSRIWKDHQNAQTIFEFLAKRGNDTVLINLNSGEVADESLLMHSRHKQ